MTRDEIIESYLVGRLSDEDRDAFEAHYFECARCFGDLQALLAIQHELSQAPARPVARWTHAAALAAAVVLAVGVILWMRPPVTPGSPEPSTVQPPPSVAQSPAQSSAAAVAPAGASAPSLEQLARIEPPRYEPLRLRGVPDEATAHFERGMEQYRKADYARAADDLREAVELDPDAAHAHFFLGVSDLLLGRDTAAIDRLRTTVALGDSPYLEEAHFYLAKAFLRQKDLDAAEMQLKMLIELGGPRTAEARQLLTAVQRLTGRSQ